MIGAGKNGPPRKYERWLSSASSGSVGLAMITDRTFQVQVQAWKVSKASVKISVCLAFSEVQVFRCMSRRTRGVSGASKLIRHARDLVDRFWGVTVGVGEDPAAEEVGVGAHVGEDNNEGSGHSEEESEDGDYIPSEENAYDDKGKKVLNSDFHGDEDEDSDDLESGFGGFDSEEDDGGAEANTFLIHKPVKDMKNYQWRVGTLYANRDEFKETVSAFAVYTTRGIKFDKCDRLRVIAKCEGNCPFILYAVKMNEEETWQLRSMNLRHSCKPV
ncbi:hypothetical protein PIB30_072301 [Stylosanthes scabra]|uniref:Transposase MuDR plant domain-containing protein n=1 Tax=Stylosanthes scabra TaxID=79078 RepID=A0ABU6VRI6_9FABA|nr:hypothetical protein [Stylosanthes scabra]